MSKGTVTIPIEEFDRLREIERENKIANREEEIATLYKQLASMSISYEQDKQIHEAELKMESHSKESILTKSRMLESQIKAKDERIKIMEEKLKVQFPWHLVFVLITFAAVALLSELIW